MEQLLSIDLLRRFFIMLAVFAAVAALASLIARGFYRLSAE
jgi:hypothetical protein